jgi:signal transduction histidine kinase
MNIKKRLTVSNLLMILVPVFITVLIAAGGLGIAYASLVYIYLPRIGLTLQDIHQIGESYEHSLSSLEIYLSFFAFILAVTIVLSVFFTNRFLTKFVYERIVKPLDLLLNGIDNIDKGNLETPIVYNYDDEFKPACDAVNHMAERLYWAMIKSQKEQQSRKELYLGISHDLRSPLTSIRAYTEALLEGIAKSPEMEKKYLETILYKEAAIERLVNQLFLFSKIEMDDFPLNLEPLNLKTEISCIIKEFPIENMNIITSGISELSILGDRELLRRIMLNIMENSRKYRNKEIGTLSITWEKNTDTARITFADNGPGVSEDMLPKLFDEFYRTDPSRQNSTDGSGLGLAIVKKAVIRMHGQVSAANSTDDGLAIIIVLPLAREV